MDVHIKGVCLGKLNRTKNTVAAFVLYADKIVHALSFDMRKDVVAFITTICNEDRFSRVRKAVCHLADSTEFVFLAPRLNQCIQISFAAKIIQGVKVQQVISFFSWIGLKVVFFIIGVSGYIQVSSIAGNKPVAFKQILAGYSEIESVKQIQKSVRRNQASALNKCRYCWHCQVKGEIVS